MNDPRVPDIDARLPRFSLERRVTVVVLLASALVVGAVAAVSIPLELFPRGFSSPFMSVMIPWRDAPPREVMEKITEPLEEELGTVRGIDDIVSVSLTGIARFYLTFRQGTDMDVAYREVRDRIERARRAFPADVDHVYTFKEDASHIPVYVMGVAVDPSVADYYNLIQKQIVLPIERIDGVANVEVNGLEEKEILIELDRDRTEASGLNIYELARQLGGDNFAMASGQVRNAGKKLLLRSVAKYRNLEEVKNRLVAPHVRLKDIATITYEEAEKRYRVRAMSKPAYAVVVFKEGEANAREVSRRIKETVEGFETDPRLAAVQIAPFFNQGDVIEESLTTLLKSGGIGGILAAVVLFFFLRRFRVMLVVSLSIPLSLVIAMTVMFFAGETLNILSLLALMVCVGLLVDNSVVVAENIDRLNQQGVPRRRATISGAGEIALAITMSTLTTVIVFLPVSLVGGAAQFFLLRMAIPISVALIASLAVALVIIPLGVYVTLPRNGKERSRRATPVHRLLERAYEASLGRVNRFYNRLLAVGLRRRIDTVLLVGVVFVVTLGVGKSQVHFVDIQENEEAGFEVDVEMPDNYTLEETEKWFLKAEKVVETHAEELGLEGWFHWHTKSQGEINGWYTTPRSTDLGPREVVERVMTLLPKEPGVKLHSGSERESEKDDGGKGVYRVSLTGEDPAQLDGVAERLESILVNVPGVLGVRRTEDRTPNELALAIDSERTQRYGVDPRVVAGVVGYALRGQPLPKHREEGREIPVRVRYQKKYRESLNELSSFLVPTSAGGALPISAVTDVRMLNSAETIVRRDKRLNRTVALDLVPGEEEAARKRLTALMAAIDLPEDVTFTDQLGRQKLDEDLAGLRYALMISIVFIYLLMGLLFESFILPLSIIFTIPLASLGVYWIHIATGLDIDFLGVVGMVLLVGVVVNNGIVLIDTVNRLRLEGMERRRAILTAADRRFRPIMMTAITTVGGMVPLAIAGRMNSGISYTSFALTLIGGMTTATLLTLLVVPVFYTFFDDLRDRMGAALRRAVTTGSVGAALGRMRFR